MGLDRITRLRALGEANYNSNKADLDQKSNEALLSLQKSSEAIQKSLKTAKKEVPVKTVKVEKVKVEGKRGRGRPKTDSPNKIKVTFSLDADISAAFKAQFFSKSSSMIENFMRSKLGR